MTRLPSILPDGEDVPVVHFVAHVLAACVDAVTCVPGIPSESAKAIADLRDALWRAAEYLGPVPKEPIRKAIEAVLLANEQERLKTKMAWRDQDEGDLEVGVPKWTRS